MNVKRFIAIDDGFDFMVKDIVTGDNLIDADGVADVLNNYEKENEQLKLFIDDLTTKGTGRIDLANGYSYSVSAVLTNWKGDVE